MLKIKQAAVKAVSPAPAPRADCKPIIAQVYPDLLTFGIKTRAKMYTADGKHYLRGAVEDGEDTAEFTIRLSNITAGANVELVNPKTKTISSVGVASMLAELASAFNAPNTSFDCDAIYTKSQNRNAESSATLAITINLDCIGHPELWIRGLSQSVNLANAVQFERDAANATLRAYNKVSAFGINDTDKDGNSIWS